MVPRGFTLLELLVSISVAAILSALALSALNAARDEAHKVACISNLKQIGAGINLYAGDNDGHIPFGPKAPAFTNPSSFYPSTGAPTSLISLQDGSRVGLGWILDYLKDPRVLFCPGGDQPIDADAELAKVGHEQAQCSYYYRHASNTMLFDNPNSKTVMQGPRLASLGDNRNGKPVRALAIDTVFYCLPGLASYHVVPRTHHGGRFVNILFSDGHVACQANTGDRYTVNLKNNNLRQAFDLILKVLEQADEEP